MNLNLITKITDSLALYVNKYAKKDEKEFKEMRYGLFVLVVNITKISMLMLTAYFLGIFKYTMTYFLCFFIVRAFAFGVHTRKSITCTILSFIVFLGGTYLSLFLKLNNYNIIFIFIISYILLYKYAPADTEDRPIINAKFRKELKIKSICCMTILLIAALILKNSIYKSIITLACFSEALFITPCIYIILGREYNNYERLCTKQN